jgi:hypothetical protein
MVRKVHINGNKVNLFLDITMALAFAVIMEERFTGLHLHELLGLAITVSFVTHLVLHWKWVVSITKRFFAKLFHESRLNYVLNLALFADIVVVIVTGIVVSKTLGLQIGLGPDIKFSLQIIHVAASHLSLVFTGLHIALHWKWILTHVQKYLLPGRIPLRKPQPVPVVSRPSKSSGEHRSWEVHRG